MAGLLVTVGKQMIAFGTAGIALKGLLEDPWTALAAGVAMVALGNVAKSSISNSLNSSSGQGSDGNFNYDTRSAMPQAANKQEITVKVEGLLEADGKGLSMALSNENTRVSLVT